MTGKGEGVGGGGGGWTKFEKVEGVGNMGKGASS